MLAKNERKTGTFSVRSGSSSHQQKELKRGGSWKSLSFWSLWHFAASNPNVALRSRRMYVQPEVHWGRKDSDGSEELYSLQACPLIQIFRWGSEYTSALIFGVSCLVLPSCSFYLLMLPPLPLLVTLHCPDWMCESNTAAAKPVPTSCKSTQLSGTSYFKSLLEL